MVLQHKENILTRISTSSSSSKIRRPKSSHKKENTVLRIRKFPTKKMINQENIITYIILWTTTKRFYQIQLKLQTSTHHFGTGEGANTFLKMPGCLNFEPNQNQIPSSNHKRTLGGLLHEKLVVKFQ